MYCLIESRWKVWVVLQIKICALAVPGGGRPRRAPLTAADLWFLCPKRSIFSIFFYARFARDSFLSIILIEIWQEHAKMTFWFNRQHFQWFSTPPVDKVHDPPKVKSWIRHCCVHHISINWPHSSATCALLYPCSLCRVTTQGILVGFLILYRYKKPMRNPFKTLIGYMQIFVVWLVYYQSDANVLLIKLAYDIAI